MKSNVRYLILFIRRQRIIVKHFTLFEFIEPIYFFLMGSAGFGKSHLIK